jgi:hypothetical protein
LNEKPLAVDILVIIKSTKERIAGYEIPFDSCTHSILGIKVSSA